MFQFKKGSSSQKEFFDGHHRREHWYRDNTVYFLTARCADRFSAFAFEAAKTIFWRQFGKYAAEHNFDVWVCTLLNNHYHAIGYLPRGSDLAPMMRKIQGSVSKLVNDLLPGRLVPFWSDYFDGCLRDEVQYRRAYRYTLLQAQRHGICLDYRRYSHTRVWMELEKGLALAQSRRAFLSDVAYKRYENS